MRVAWPGLLLVVLVLQTGCRREAETSPKPSPSTTSSAGTEERTPGTGDEPATEATDADTQAVNGLRPAAAFAHLEPEARSVALFEEAAKVITHPRCVNCHPAGDRPRQGDAGLPHQPLVVRGDDNHGVAALRCSSCHGESNFRNVPGNPDWHLAPLEMAWEGRSLAQICAQLKDPKRNGGKDLQALVRHMAEDSLVGYGWRPPAHLEPAPGSQKVLGELIAAWVDAGALCPPEAPAR